MDLNDLRSLATVLVFAAFIGIAVWAWSGRRRADFDAAANLPLVDDAPVQTHPGEKQ
jgi:cytochrome c oxidase cbb3-type subunit IV